MSEKWVSMRLAPVPCVCTNHNNIEFAATQNNAIATFTLPFLLLLLSLKRLVYSREKEEKKRVLLVVKWPTSNQPDPRGRNRTSQSIMSYRSWFDSKPYSSLNPRFGLQEKNLPGRTSSCLPHGVRLLRARTVTPMYAHRQCFWHRCSCGSQQLD